MRFLLRVIAVFMLMYAALSAVRGLLGAFASTKQVPPSDAGHLVKDPVCGTYVPQSTALQARGEFFCSEACRRKFEQKAG